MKRVAVVGSVGIPANYGGFEFLVENLIGEYKSHDIEYTVFCSKKNYSQQRESYKGAKLKYLPLSANGAQSILYDIISIIWASFICDIILVLGVSGCCILPIYRLLFPRKKLVINIDGLEHRRDKWGIWVRRFLKFSEKMAIKYADVIITDNKGIQEYVKTEYAKSSVMIAYGGDHAINNYLSELEQTSILQKWGLERGKYLISVCRIEPENNCHITLDAFSQIDQNLVFIGNWNKSEYGLSLKTKYQGGNIKIIDPIYDVDILFALRNNAAGYIHGHSAGGTNPSLVEAMFFNIPIYAYDVIYNRETTQNRAFYYNNVENLKELFGNCNLDYEENANAMKTIANNQYTWRKIVEQYESLY